MKVKNEKGVAELWLHFLWKEGRFSEYELFAEDGRKLLIRSPGWYNRGWGPDFADGRIQIGDDEFFGDIEIHCEESAWRWHQHMSDEAYNRVILHVFLIRSNEQARNQLGQIVPALCLDKIVEKMNIRDTQAISDLMIQELPGVCGLLLSPRLFPKMKMLIFQAAEQRLLDKAEWYLTRLRQGQHHGAEELLYRGVFKALGQTAYSEVFEVVSQRYPYANIRQLLRSLHRQSRLEVLGRWFGALGLLGQIDSSTVHDDMRREWIALQQFWAGIQGERIPLDKKHHAPSRPLNHPIRRLTGLYYHLQHVQFQGLIKSWLTFLMKCRELIDENKKSTSTVMRLLDEMFPQPDWDPLNHLLSVVSNDPNVGALRLIGQQRQLVILSNAIIPFFIAWARVHREPQIEKTLMALFLVLPAEGKNRKTQFMEQRLFGHQPHVTIRKNLSYYQGLIQLHDDCCRSFYEGCNNNCSLVKMLLLKQDSSSTPHGEKTESSAGNLELSRAPG